MGNVYYCEQDELELLRMIAARLCGGNDKERDEGNRMVVILDRIEAKQVIEL